MTEKQKYIWYPILTAAVAGLLVVAIIRAIDNLLPSFLIVLGTLLCIVGVIWLVLMVHNLFYHATFLMIKYFFQNTSNNYDDALRTLHRIIQMRPDDTFPLLEQVRIYIDRNDFSSAQDSLNKAMALVGERLDVLELQTNLFWQWEKWDQVAITIKKMLNISPDRVDLRQDLLAAYFYTGKYHQGIKEINEFIKDLIKAAKSLEDRTKYLSARQKLWTAVDAQQRAMALLGDTLKTLQTSKNNQADKHVHSKLVQLVEVVEELASVNPKDYNLYRCLADLSFTLGNYNLSVGLLHKVAKFLTDRIKSFEKQSLYEVARNELWVVVDYQTEIIQLMSRNLASPKFVIDLQGLEELKGNSD